MNSISLFFGVKLECLRYCFSRSLFVQIERKIVLLQDDDWNGSTCSEQHADAKPFLFFFFLSLSRLVFVPFFDEVW